MKKKIFFMHIPKTAGSSFNAFLKRNFNGEEHCEIHLASDGITLHNLDHLHTLEYISGHLRWATFLTNRFSREEYFVMTFLRNPCSQLLSHLNWLIHIYDIGSDFFQAHPKEIQQLSLELRRTNLYETDSFISILRRFSNFFQNSQSDCFVVNPVRNSSDFIIETMLQLDAVGLTEYYEESLKLIIYLNQLDVTPQVDIKNKNTTYAIQKDILENNSIHSFIQEYNQRDFEVYNYFLNILKSRLGTMTN